MRTSRMSSEVSFAGEAKSWQGNRHTKPLLGVISKVCTSRTNERTFIWHFTPSPRSQTKVWSTMGEMYGRWLKQSRFISKIVFDDWQRRSPNTRYRSNSEGTGFQRNPHSSSQPAQTISSVARMQEHFPGGSASIAKRTRWQSRAVEKYDVYSFFSFSACSKADGRCRSTRCRTRVSAIAPSTWPSNAQSISADQLLPHACTFRLGDQATTLDTFLESNSLSTTWWTTEGQAFFFFLLSIAQQNGSKPPPPIWKFFRLSATYEFWDDPLLSELDRDQCEQEAKLSVYILACVNIQEYHSRDLRYHSSLALHVCCRSCQHLEMADLDRDWMLIRGLTALSRLPG